MTYNAFDELQAITMTALSTNHGPVDIIILSDLRDLIGADQAVFDAAVDKAKFSSVVQEVNTQVYFTYDDEHGELLTVEAAIAVASLCPPDSEFVRQMATYAEEAIEVFQKMAQFDEDPD